LPRVRVRASCPLKAESCASALPAFLKDSATPPVLLVEWEGRNNRFAGRVPKLAGALKQRFPMGEFDSPRFRRTFTLIELLVVVHAIQRRPRHRPRIYRPYRLPPYPGSQRSPAGPERLSEPAPGRVQFPVLRWVGALREGDREPTDIRRPGDLRGGRSSRGRPILRRTGETCRIGVAVVLMIQPYRQASGHQ
jgi:hypothetical protein